MSEQKLILLLGLAQKAGKLVSGEFAVEKAAKSGKAKLVIIADDSSEATKKNYYDLAKNYNLSLYERLSKDQLGNCIGKSHRAALAVMDEGFSKAVVKTLLE